MCGRTCGALTSQQDVGEWVEDPRDAGRVTQQQWHAGGIHQFCESSGRFMEGSVRVA
jgi:hypothetical protein